MTTVDNLKNHRRDAPGTKYIGRINGTSEHFGNPASFQKSTLATVFVESRDVAVQWYDDWLNGKYPEVEPERRQWILDHLHLLKDKILLCFCYPKKCHGDVLAKRVNRICI